MGLDAATFDSVYSANANRLYSTAFRLLHDADAAADVVQDAFLKAYSSTEEIREPGAWLTTVARNTALNVLRRSGRLVPLAGGADDDESAVPELVANDPLADPTQAAATADALAIVDELLGELPPAQRTALLLFHAQDQPIATIAHLLGRTVNATTVFLHRSRAALRAGYAERVYARTNIPVVCRAFRPELLAHVARKPTSQPYLDHLAVDPVCQAIEAELRGMGHVLGLLPILPAPVVLKATTAAAVRVHAASAAMTTSAGAAANEATAVASGTAGGTAATGGANATFLGTLVGKVIVAVLAVATVGSGVAIVGLISSSAEVTVTFDSSAAGTISPSGAHTYHAGEVVQVVVRPKDAAWRPGLMVDAEPTRLSARDDGTYTVALSFDRDRHVQATYAQLAANVRQLDAATAAALVDVAADESQAVFGQTTPLLDALVPGDIITNAIDDGLSRPVMLRVRSIERAVGRVVLATEPASLDELLENASVAVVLPTRVADVRNASTILAVAGLDAPPPMAPAVPAAVPGDGLGVHAAIGVDLASGACGGLECKIRAEGEFSASFDVGFNLDIGFFTVDRLEVYFAADEEAVLRLLADAGLAGERRAPLLSADFAQIVVMIGPLPVWLSPGVDLSVGANWQVAAQGQFETSFSAHQKVGARFEGGRWAQIDENERTLTGSVSFGGSAALSAFVGPEPRISIYHFCEVLADVQAPFAELDADTAADPWWTLYGGVRLAGIAARCDFTDRYEFELEVGIRTIIAQADGPFAASAGATPVATTSTTPTAAAATPVPTSSIIPHATPSPSVQPTSAPSDLTPGIAFELCNEGCGDESSSQVLTIYGVGFRVEGLAGAVLTLTYPDGNSAVFNTPDGASCGQDGCFQPEFDIVGPLPLGRYKAVIVGTNVRTGAPARAEGVYTVGR